MICEMGANTIRLAHYQHAQYFYDLCDERGIVVWAEIPYISKHLEKGVENTMSQMKELIYQNYNHPSIVVWGLSNEITMGGATSPIVENHKMLNDLVHSLDKTRLTTEAVLTACNINEEYVHIRMFFHITIISDGTAAMCQCTAIGLIHSTRNIQTRQSV